MGYTLPEFAGTLPMQISVRFRVNNADIGVLDDLTGTPGSGTATQPMTVRVFVTNAAGTAQFDSTPVAIQAAPGGGTGTWTVGPWRAPERDSDNALIADLGGYALYYSQDPQAGIAGTRVLIANPATLSYVLTGLSSGRWYAWLASVDTGGNEGPEYRLGFKDIA